ncbi:thioether cross-link-forming SCIFF peptide maturase [Metallumcola ferriviriculae]|uniref:Thioether cross-link-forming SCIFF peptide maturase n=1 Tax=Metallumcola ferriviriculae TaxID=3039180 RepID=A0AAU0ULE4_9FIRM|nr:thioether cross-link-forming SCIFF peptide maturase [Desulfitibacteraceae bacterium MK1]
MNLVNQADNIHIFSYRELNILLDVNSGAVHLLTDTAAAIVAAAIKGASADLLQDKFGNDAVSQVMTELRGLQQQGVLASPVEDNRLPQEEVSYIKSLCLHVSHDCNLRCRYCFAGTGRFGGDRELMTADTAKQAVDFLLAASGPRQFCEIDFFGGEPLMNFSVVMETVKYAQKAAAIKGKKINLTLTTNGMLLDEDVRRFLVKNEIKLVLSLDGRPEINDYIRPGAGGKGSYREIVPKFKAMVNELGGKNYYIRGTYTKHNRDFAADIAHMLTCGFRELSIEPVVASSEAGYALTEEDYPFIASEYDRLVDLYLEYWDNGDPFNFFHFNVNLEQGPCLAKRLRGCGAGFEYLAVTPGGELYPCHQFVGDEKFRIGTVTEGIINTSVGETFKQTHVYNKEECRRCWARFYCGGGCNANAYQQSGDLFEPYKVGCLVQRKRLECAIYLETKKLIDTGGGE